MSGEKTSVHTLVINAIPQGHIEAVVAATLCSNFIHVTCREVGGWEWQRYPGGIYNPAASTPTVLRGPLTPSMCARHSLPRTTKSPAACIHSTDTFGGPTMSQAGSEALGIQQ